MTKLNELLAALARQHCRTQSLDTYTLAERTGFNGSSLLVERMLNGTHEGTMEQWDKLLTAIFSPHPIEELLVTAAYREPTPPAGEQREACGAPTETTPPTRCRRKKGHDGPHENMWGSWSNEPGRVPTHIQRTLELLGRMSTLEKRLEKVEGTVQRILDNFRTLGI